MTVAELKERMSARELGDWVAYEAEMGPLSQTLRIDAAVYRAAAAFIPRDKQQEARRVLMPWPKEPEPEPASAEDAFKLLSQIFTTAKPKD